MKHVPASDPVAGEKLHRCRASLGCVASTGDLRRTEKSGEGRRKTSIAKTSFSVYDGAAIDRGADGRLFRGCMTVTGTACLHSQQKEKKGQKKQRQSARSEVCEAHITWRNLHSPCWSPNALRCWRFWGLMYPGGNRCSLFDETCFLRSSGDCRSGPACALVEPSRLEAIAIGLEAITSKVEAIASRFLS